MHRRHALLAMVAALLCSRPAGAGPVDKPAEYVIDISDSVGEPAWLCVKAKKGLWQLPAARVRKGYGAAFYLVDDPKLSSSDARIYVEVEPLGDRFIADAANDVLKALADTMAPFDTQLVGDAIRSDETSFKLGRTKLQGHKIYYKSDIVTAVPRTQNESIAVVVSHGKALITITLESFDNGNESVQLKKLLSSISIETKPPKPDEIRVKLIDAADLLYRFLTFEIPKGFQAKHKDCEYGVAATFVHSDAKAEIGRPRVLVQRLERPERRGMKELKKVVEFWHNESGAMYEDATELTEIKVSGVPAYRFAYTEKTENGEWRVFRVIFQMRDQLWGINFECDAKNEDAVSQADRAFGGLVSSIVTWTGAK